MKKKHLLIPLLMMFSISGCVMYNGLEKEEAEHEHTYAETYSFNETDHWFAATCEHTDLTKDKENHSFSDYVVTQEPTLYEEGLKVRTCNICGYKDEVKLDKLIDNSSTEPGGGGSQENPSESWDITAINVDRENIELTVGDAPITVVPRLLGEGNFPASIKIECKEGTRVETVDGEEVTKTYKVADVNRNIVESGSGFTVSPVSAGNTQIILSAGGKPTVTKTIEVSILAKPEVHELTISDETLTVNKGSHTVLSCNSTDDVTWTSSDETIITLENKTNSGVWLKAIKSSGEGTVTITATICAGTSNEVVKTCVVTVVSNEQTVFDYYYVNNQKLTDLYVYLWGANGTNAPWPGVSLGEADYINKDLNEVYKITIDKDVNDFDKMIISGKDSVGDLQTDDIVLASFVTQNAFTIPSIPNDVVDGVRKASVRMGNFNPSEDTLSGSYITLSMNNANLIVDEEIYVYCYTNANEVDYTVTSGDDKIQLVNETYSGFTIRALAAGEADIEAKVVSGESSETTHLHVTVIDDEIVTYYFANNYQWKNLKVYMWGKHENAEFPGNFFAHAPIKNKDNVNTYEISFSKYTDGYTGMVISGTDDNKGSCKTQDIYFADLDAAGKNMIRISEETWMNTTSNGDGTIQYICSISMETFETAAPKIEVSQSNITMVVGQTVEVTIDANVEYDVIAEESMTCSITVSDNKITITANRVGTFGISVQAKEGGLGADIDVNVVEDETVSYYFVNNYKWRDLKVFFWNNTTQKTNGEFPGVSIGERSFVDRNGNDVYAVSFMKYADNYEGFIISGTDETKGQCKTQDIMIAGFDDNNGVELNGWKEGEETTALTRYGFYAFELFLNIASEVEFGEGTTIRLNATTNGTNVAYNLTSGSDVIELQNEADDGVTIVGKKAGTATFTASVQEGTQTVTKTVNVTVLLDETLTYYFINEYEWGYVDAYLYASGQRNNGWPGVPMTLLGRDENGKEVYSVEFKKYSDGWIGMVITGSDDLNGTYAKTSDIIFSELNGNDCIRVTGWADMDNFVASYETKVMGDYLLLSDYSLTMSKSANKTITYVSNKDVSVANSDPSVIQITELADGVEINSLKAGTSTITFTIGEGENTISKTCEVTVNSDDPDYVTYYFANNYAWSDLKVYLWDDVGQSNASFPGVPLNDNNYILNSEGNYTYEITFDKNEHNWTHCIISGFDSGKNSLCKTENINFGDLNLSGKNMISINETEWNNIDTPDGVNYYKCSYQTDVFTSFVPDVSISETAKSINVNEMIELSITSNTDYEVVNGNGGIIRVIRNGDKLLVKGLKAGSSTIEVFVDRGGPQEKKVTCAVTVENATTPLYSVKGNFPDWYFNDNPKFYVWAWGGEVEGSGMWIKCYVIDDEIQFSTNINFEHCKLVRFKPETTTPEWGSNVWNESSELTFNSQNIAVYPD